MAFIKFEEVSKQFGTNEVLKKISMEVKKGDLVTLLGPSGCGKSTLLRCLAGLEDVSSGKIILDGEDITKWNPGRRNVGMVFQQYSLFPNMNVEENVGFGLSMLKLPKAVIAEKVKWAIELVELCGKEKAFPVHLSGGQQQRVALARSIVMEPKVLLLDEPLSAIDAKLRKALQQKIREIHEELGLTIIFVTHDQDEAMVMSDQIHLFYEGKIEQSGNPVAMYTMPQTKFAASFIGNYNILKAEEFTRLVGVEIEAEKEVVIRPETITISKVPLVREDEYIFMGEVKSTTPRGNVLRYSIDAKGVKLQADVLFRSFTLFEKGACVYISIPKRDCLELA